MLTYHNLSQTAYVDLLVSLISHAEGPEPAAVDRQDGQITIGYGYTFGRNDNVALWQAAGIVLTPQDLAVLQSIDAAATLAQKNQIAITFSRTVSIAEAAELLKQTYPRYEGPVTTLGMPISNERAAFVSITYNRGVGSTANAMGAFASALNNSDRAEAWYQLRYQFWGSNTSVEAGLRARRLVESQLFGLQEQPGATPNAQEAAQIFRMIERHRSDIISLEKRWGVSPDGLQGQPTRNLIAEVRNDARWSTFPRVDTIIEALDPAKTTLLTDLRTSNPDLVTKLQDAQWLSTNIYVAKTPSPISSAGDTLDSKNYEFDSFSAISTADLMVGDVGNDTLKGNKGNDLLLGNAGKDTLDGGVGDDTLVGGTGNDQLIGGDGTDTYVFKPGEGKDTVQDSDGKGSIKVAGNPLVGAGVADYVFDVNQSIWSVNNGETIYTLDERANKLVITGTSLGADSQITINNFDLSKAEGYLGIKLERPVKTAFGKPGSANPFTGTNTPTDLTANVSEGSGTSYKLFLAAPACAGDTLVLNGSGPGVGQCSIVRGDDTVPLAGGVTLTLVEGQTEIAFALLETAPLSANSTVTLSASYTSDGQTATSANTATITLVDAGKATHTYIGDQHAPTRADGSFDWGATSWTADGTLTGGVGEANFADVVDGTSGTDKIEGKGGNDALDGGDGNDQIDGGDGDDLIGGGLGSDTIQGGAGNDYITSSATLGVQQRHKTTDHWTAPNGTTTITQGPGWGIFKDASGAIMWEGTNAPSGNDGDVIDGGAGNDHIIASGGNDRAQGGTGDDEIDGLGGDDILEGGSGKDFINADGLIRTKTMSSVAGQYHGNDFIDGGSGDDTLLGGGGNDQLYGGADNDDLWGDGTGDTGSDNQLAPTYHGNDYLDGEDGNDTLEGGGKDDTLYGGSNNDKLWGDTDAANVATPADASLLWGNDNLDGEDGDDELIGGGKDDTLVGGTGADKLWGDQDSASLAGADNGKDTLDGGDGNDQLVGGGNDDTLYGGNDDDALWGDSSLNFVAAEFHGNDVLDGGDGNDSLYGDGGDDTLYGGAGNDTLDGGTGADTLSGGAGSDTYVVDNAGDMIVDADGADALYERWRNPRNACAWRARRRQRDASKTIAHYVVFTADKGRFVLNRLKRIGHAGAYVGLGHATSKTTAPMGARFLLGGTIHETTAIDCFVGTRFAQRCTGCEL